MSNKEWIFIYALPNLIINEPFETEYLAIVPLGDKRLRAIRNNIPSVKKLLTNFKTVTGKKVKPSALIWRKDAPESIKQNEAVVAFRNSLAISSLLYSCSVTVNADNVFGLIFSDHFDFSPATIGKDGSFHISSPALEAYGPKLEKFYGSTYSHLDYNKIHEARLDKFLAKKILKKWNERFVSPAKDTWDTRLLFRSLEIAYQAMVTPFRNNSSLYEHGTYLSLWVSAFEILVHKKPGDSVGSKRVREFLGTYKWGPPKLDNRRYIVFKDKSGTKIFRGNLVQKLYMDLYNARCKFLHGNQVKVSQIYPFQNKNRPHLGMLVPAIYWIALSAFLPSEYDENDTSLQTRLKKNVEALHNTTYGVALLASIGVNIEDI